MKKLALLSAVALGLAFTACDDNDIIDIPVNQEPVIFQTDNLQISAAAQTQSVLDLKTLNDNAENITVADIALTNAPSPEDLKRLDPFYLSYFLPWNSYENYVLAKSRGFHDLTHEWDRTHHAENFDQIDSPAYLVHSWLKYPKFGHAAATDYTARYIRYGMMTREEAIPIIKQRDGELDPRCVREFCEFCGYRESEFWAIIDKFYNRDLFEKDFTGKWQLKNPIWKENESK